MNYETILIDQVEGVRIITLNRPEVLNALSLQMVTELDLAMDSMASDDSVKALIITGAGDKAFSAGADIHEMRTLTPDEAEIAMETRYKAQWRLATYPKPVLGALNGLCYGGGTVLATSLDFLIGSEHSEFRFVAVAYGQMNATWTLANIVGWPMAKEILYTARVISAQEAYRVGLLNHLVPPENVLVKALELAQIIAANHPGSIQGIKSLVNSSPGRSWEEMWRSEYVARKTAYKGLSVEEGFKDFITRKGKG